MQISTSPKILIVEDDEALRVTLVMALEDAGHVVHASTKGDEGLRLAREQRPDLIVSDVHLPVGDGRSLLTAVRADPELSTCQFVLMTGDVKGATQRGGMDLGADDYLAKPFTTAEFLECVAARLRRAELSRQAEDRAVKWLRDTVSNKLPHEIFTPLSGILGLSELLRDDLGNVPANIARDMVTDIQRSAERLHRVLKNYLTILDLREESPLGAGPDEKTEAVEVVPVLQSAAKTTTDAHDRTKDLAFWGEEIALPVDSRHLTSIITELIDNACKYSRPGTRIAVRLRAAAGEAQLTISDQGRGMTAEQVARIGAFRQFDRHKHEQQGLGLGLTLVQHLAWRNRGNVRIASTPNQGTVVTVAWPTASVVVTDSSS